MAINKFCGPYAYGKITGLSSNEAARVLAGHDWRYEEAGTGYNKPVRSVLGMAMRTALKATGAVVGELRRPGMTLATWANVRLKWVDPNAWVVFVSGHFVVYRQGFVYDNGSPLGVPLMAHEAAKQRIKSATCVSIWNDANPFR